MNPSQNRGKRTFSGAFASSSWQDVSPRRSFGRRRVFARADTPRFGSERDIEWGEDLFVPDQVIEDALGDDFNLPLAGPLADGEDEDRPPESNSVIPEEDTNTHRSAESSAGQECPADGDQDQERLAGADLEVLAAEDEDEDEDEDANAGAAEIADPEWTMPEPRESSPVDTTLSMSLLQSVRAAQEDEERAIAVSLGEQARQWGESARARGFGHRGIKRERIRQRNNAGSAEEIEEKWEDTLATISPSFVEGDEALLKVSKTKRGDLLRGMHLYSGLPVYPVNNSDLNYIYKIGYAAKASRQSPVDGAFAQLRSTFGQLCRFIVAARVTRLDRLFEEGAIFKSLNHDVMDLFLKFFIMNSAPSTVAMKANHCSVFCQHGMRFFNSRGMPRDAAKLDEVLQFVRGTSANAKAEDRIAVARRTIQSRLEQKKFVTGQQMKMLRSECLKVLHSICATLREVESAEGRDGVLDALKNGTGLLSKFSLNFLALLVLTGGGQRPQVYASLVNPSEAEIRAWTRSVQIPVVREKTLRQKPCIVFPLRIKEVVTSYVNYVRPAIVELKKVPDVEKSLILHTRYGCAITPDSVRSTFKTFASRIGEEFSNLTPMCIRTSYATHMLCRYRNGEAGRGMQEAQFMSDLAMSMNTSPEMLRSTYVMLGEDDYQNAARHLSEHINEEVIE